MRKRVFDGFEVLLIQVNVNGKCILFEARYAARARNRNDILVVAEKPCQRNLRSGTPFFPGKVLKAISQREIG